MYICIYILGKSLTRHETKKCVKTKVEGNQFLIKKMFLSKLLI